MGKAGQAGVSEILGMAKWVSDWECAVVRCVIECEGSAVYESVSG